MKRTGYILTSLLLLIVLAVGCTAKVDINSSIETLKSNGFTVSKEFATEEELTEANEMANSEIESVEGGFSVKIKRMIALVSKDDEVISCQFIEFETVKQAKKYVELYDSMRGDDITWKIAQSGAVVVTTNSQLAQDLLDLKFK